MASSTKEKPAFIPVKIAEYLCIFLSFKWLGILELSLIDYLSTKLHSKIGNLNIKNMKILILLLLSISAHGLEVFSKGEIQDLLSIYDDSEIIKINRDLKSIRDALYLGVNPQKNPLFIGIFGCIGTYKNNIPLDSSQINSMKNGYVVLDFNYIMACMLNTKVKQEILDHKPAETSISYIEWKRRAYMHWINATIYVMRRIMNESVSNSYNIKSEISPIYNKKRKLLRQLIDNNYRLEFIVTSSNTENRMQSYKYQVSVLHHFNLTQFDVFNIPYNIARDFPIIFEYADKIYLYWTEKFYEPSKLVASINNKKLLIQSQGYYDKFVQEYDKHIADQELSWDKIVG